MIEQKIIGNIIHQLEQFQTFIYDGLSLSPCQNCRKKTCYLDVLFFWRIDVG